MKNTINKDHILLKLLFVILIVALLIFSYYDEQRRDKVLEEFSSNYTVIEHQAGSMICVEKATGNLYHVHRLNDNSIITFVIDSPVYDENGNIKNANK